MLLKHDESFDFPMDTTFPLSKLSDKKSKSGSLLHLREKFCLPIEALELVDTTLEEYAKKKSQHLRLFVQLSRPSALQYFDPKNISPKI